MEAYCNSVAEAALVPAAVLRARLPDDHTQDWTLEQLSEIAEDFRVSKEVVLRRLLTMGFINPSLARLCLRFDTGADRSQVSGYLMQPQDFDVITAHAVDRDVVLVQNQFAGIGHPARPPHARMRLQLGHRVLQLQHEAGGTGGVVLGNEASNFIDAAQRRLRPLQRRRSGAVFGEHSLDLIVGGEFAGIGFLDALVDVTDLPGLALHIVGQRINGEEALGPRGGLGQLFDLVVERFGQADVDGLGGHGVTLCIACITAHSPLHRPDVKVTNDQARVTASKMRGTA